MSRRHPHPRTRSRNALAIALVCLAAQCFGLVHLFAVRHVRGGARGELLHVAPLTAGAPGAGGTSTTLGVAGHGTGEIDHDHCPLFTEVVDAYHGSLHLVAAPVPTPSALAVAVPVAPLARTVALYRLAPKVSPPVHA